MPLGKAFLIIPSSLSTPTPTIMTIRPSTLVARYENGGNEDSSLLERMSKLEMKDETIIVALTRMEKNLEKLDTKMDNAFKEVEAKLTAKQNSPPKLEKFETKVDGGFKEVNTKFGELDTKNRRLDYCCCSFVRIRRNSVSRAGEHEAPVLGI